MISSGFSTLSLLISNVLAARNGYYNFPGETNRYILPMTPPQWITFQPCKPDKRFQLKSKDEIEFINKQREEMIHDLNTGRRRFKSLIKQ